MVNRLSRVDKGYFDPCCCDDACVCTSCIDSVAPCEFQVVLEDNGFTTSTGPGTCLFAGGTACEDDVPGTYTLPENVACEWLLENAFTIQCDSPVPYDIRIKIDTFAGDRRLTVTLESGLSNEVRYRKNYGASDIDCDGLSSEVIAYDTDNDSVCVDWDLLTVKVTSL